MFALIGRLSQQGTLSLNKNKSPLYQVFFYLMIIITMSGYSVSSHRESEVDFPFFTNMILSLGFSFKRTPYSI